MASTAGRLRPMTSAPQSLALPMIGPSPSMPTMPSTIARWGCTVALMSRIELWMPCQCRDVLGPAVDDAGHDAEQVFHGACHAGPVMGL